MLFSSAAEVLAGNQSSYKKGAFGDNFTDLSVAADTFGGVALQIDRNMSATETSAFRVNGYYESLENHRDFFDGDQIGESDGKT